MVYILLTARYRGSFFLLCQAHRSFGIPFQGEAFLSLCRLQPVAAFEAREGKGSVRIQNVQARNSKIYSFIIKNLPVPRLPFFDASFLIF
jgi:hypothetical protein